MRARGTSRGRRAGAALSSGAACLAALLTLVGGIGGASAWDGAGRAPSSHDDGANKARERLEPGQVAGGFSLYLPLVETQGIAAGPPAATDTAAPRPTLTPRPSATPRPTATSTPRVTRVPTRTRSPMPPTATPPGYPAPP